MQANAPFASTAITLSLGSTTGLKYKTLNCIECGDPLVERNGDVMYRISKDWPEQARVSANGTIPTTCSKCTQKYVIVISHNVTTVMDGVPLYMQPQSVFIAITGTKKLRDTHCLECGKAYLSLSDRVNSISDNIIPFDLLDPDKLGPLEVWCKYQHCKQRWSIMA